MHNLLIPDCGPKTYRGMLPLLWARVSPEVNSPKRAKDCSIHPYLPAIQLPTDGAPLLGRYSCPKLKDILKFGRKVKLNEFYFVQDFPHTSRSHRLDLPKTPWSTKRRIYTSSASPIPDLRIKARRERFPAGFGPLPCQKPVTWRILKLG